MSLHARFPLDRGNPGGRAAVGDDFHVPIGHQYIDEYAVAKFGVPDAQMRENLQGARSRGVTPAHRSRKFERGFDHEADLAAGARLGRPDGGFDRWHRQRR